MRKSQNILKARKKTGKRMDLPDVQEDRKSTIRRLPGRSGRKKAGLFREGQTKEAPWPDLQKDRQRSGRTVYRNPEKSQQGKAQDCRPASGAGCRRNNPRQAKRLPKKPTARSEAKKHAGKQAAQLRRKRLKKRQAATVRLPRRRKAERKTNRSLQREKIIKQEDSFRLRGVSEVRRRHNPYLLCK